MTAPDVGNAPRTLLTPDLDSHGSTLPLVEAQGPPRPDRDPEIAHAALNATLADARDEGSVDGVPYRDGVGR